MSEDTHKFYVIAIDWPFFIAFTFLKVLCTFFCSPSTCSDIDDGISYRIAVEIWLQRDHSSVLFLHRSLVLRAPAASRINSFKYRKCSEPSSTSR